MNELTTLSVVNGTAFTTVDFNGLAEQLQALADHSGTLSETEKAFAIDLVGKWENDVLRLLSNKVDYARRISYAFESKQFYNVSKEVIEAFVVLGGQKSKLAYEKYLKADEDLKTASKTIEAPIFELDTTLEDRERMKSEYDREKALQRIKVEAETRKRSIAESKVFETMLGSAKVKEALDKIKSFTSDTSSMESKCRMISQSAKINIVIQNQEVRTALKDILSFSDNF